MSETPSDSITWIKAILLDHLGVTCEHAQLVMKDTDQTHSMAVATYRLSLLGNSGSESANSSMEPAEFPLPQGINSVMMRVYPPGVSFQTELTAMDIMYEALTHAQKHLVPILHRCGRDPNNDYGWTVCQDLPGVSVAQHFHQMTTGAQARILSQLADVLQSIQDYDVPTTIEGFGAVEYDYLQGLVNSFIDPEQRGYSSLEVYHQTAMSFSLAQADTCGIARGWHDNGVRERLEVFMVKGIPAVLSHVTSRRKVLVHGALMLSNLLFNPETHLLTGLTSFSHVHIGVLPSEFIASFSDIHGLVPGPQYLFEGPLGATEGTPEADAASELNLLRNSLLTKFPRKLPPNSATVNWVLARMWDDELKGRRGGRSPAEVEGVAELSGLYWIKGVICGVGAGLEADESGRERVEAGIVRYLESKGY